ncbi:MAG: rRNA guanine-N(1)-methyltransferase [Conexibacter sp.]|nr:rRNA guanine-N(1)-methyltransferase [Conexibacter sp.]
MDKVAEMLRTPPADAPPSEEAFIAYEESLDVNWSAELEALHEEASRDHFLDVWTRTALLDALGDTTPDVVLDAGCSSGYLLEDLRARYPQATLLGVDLVAAGLRRAHGLVPDAKLLLADVCHLPVEDGTVDAVLSANLLEHVPDDVGALGEFFRVLKPGGIAAIIVPAGPGTYDYYDAFLGHERRYARGELARKGVSQGFEVVHDTHIGSLIYPAFWAVKKRNRMQHKAPTPEQRQALVEKDIDRTTSSRLGAATTKVERTLLERRVSLPFGIRSLAILRKGPA